MLHKRIYVMNMEILVVSTRKLTKKIPLKALCRRDDLSTDPLHYLPKWTEIFQQNHMSRQKA